MMARPATAEQVGDVSFTLVMDKLHDPTRMTPNQGVAEPIRAGVPAELTGENRAMTAGARSC